MKKKPDQKDAHIRYDGDKYDLVAAAAKRAGLGVTPYIRNRSIEAARQELDQSDSATSAESDEPQEKE